MLVLPEKGIRPSTKSHNCDLMAVVDWVLGSALFCEEDVTRSDVADVLIENQVYREQDLCSEFVESVWGVLRVFFSHVVSNALRLDSRGLRVSGDWREDKALAYCVTASLRPIYPAWSKEYCGDSLVQGGILEGLARLALSNYYPGVDFKVTGWSGIEENQNFKGLVEQICRDGNFTQKNLELWDNGYVKDMGLDVYGFLPGHGRRPGVPFMMFQCASGDNWKTKRTTPDINIWANIVEFYAKPLKGMAIPFLVDETEFQQSLCVIQGPLLDRSMLLGGLKEVTIPEELGERIESWVAERVGNLQFYA